MTYVMGDIHGNLRRFESVMKQIDLQPKDTLYQLGDVIDRHPDGIMILRRIMAATNIKMILGNHEYMMLRALGEPYDGPEDIAGKKMSDLIRLWYHNGGNITHRSWKHQRNTTKADIIKYLHTLPLNREIEVNGKKYLLVHGAPEDVYPQYVADLKGKDQIATPDSRTHFAVWDREMVTLCTTSDDETIIFGHSTTSHFQKKNPLEVWCHDHLIGIDCGSGLPSPEELFPFDFRRGRLACIRLEDMKVFYSEEEEGDEKHE